MGLVARRRVRCGFIVCFGRGRKYQALACAVAWHAQPGERPVAEPEFMDRRDSSGHAPEPLWITFLRHFHRIFPR